MFSAQGISLFLLATGRTQKETKDSDHSERFSFRKHGSNQSALRYEEFLHTKISNKDVHVYYGDTESQETHTVFRQYGGRFGSIAKVGD